MLYGDQLYGTSIYGQVTEDLTPEDMIPDLMKYLPRYYSSTSLMNILQQKAIAPEVGLVNWSIQDMLLQFFVDTATWGLDLWEKFLDIETDPLKNYLNRREAVKAKLRGQGTTTVAMIKMVAAAFSGGEVEVIEYSNEYRFVVKFVGTRGIPANMQALTKTIESIKPAHLGFGYAYTFMIWQEAKAFIWNQVQPLTWTQFRDTVL